MVDCFPFRFRDPEEELELSCKVVPYLDDNIQLSIEEYRDKLYEVLIRVLACMRVVGYFVDLLIANIPQLMLLEKVSLSEHSIPYGAFQSTCSHIFKLHRQFVLLF